MALVSHHCLVNFIVVFVERWPQTFEPVHCTCCTWSSWWADVGQ